MNEILCRAFKNSMLVKHHKISKEENLELNVFHFPLSASSELRMPHLQRPVIKQTEHKLALIHFLLLLLTL